MSESNNKDIKFIPIVIFVLGIVLGIVSFTLFIIEDPASIPSALGAIAAIAAIILTFIIAQQQNHASAQSHSILLQLKEQKADRDYQETNTEDSSAEGKESPEFHTTPHNSEADEQHSSSESNSVPTYLDEAISRLQERKANLDFDNLRWRRKIPSPALRGHHGWFVESNSGDNKERWFVRKANGVTARRAMPRDFLDALEEQAGIDPKTIRLDFQDSDHALASWYARTYSDDLWKVSRSNRNPSRGITVTQVDS